MFKPLEFLLSPAVWLLADRGRGPGTISAQVNVGFAAILDGALVLRLVHHAGHIGHAHTGREFVDGAGVATLAGPARTTVYHSLHKDCSYSAYIHIFSL